MGGHALKRTDPSYSEVVKVGEALTRSDYLPMTAYQNEPQLMQAIDMLACAPTISESQWLPSAYRVIEHFDLHNPRSSASAPGYTMSRQRRSPAG